MTNLSLRPARVLPSFRPGRLNELEALRELTPFIAQSPSPESHAKLEVLAERLPRPMSTAILDLVERLKPHGSFAVLKAIGEGSRHALSGVAQQIYDVGTFSQTSEAIVAEMRIRLPAGLEWQPRNATMRQLLLEMAQCLLQPDAVMLTGDTAYAVRNGQLVKVEAVAPAAIGLPEDGFANAGRSTSVATPQNPSSLAHLFGKVCARTAKGLCELSCD